MNDTPAAPEHPEEGDTARVSRQEGAPAEPPQSEPAQASAPPRYAPPRYAPPQQSQQYAQPVYPQAGQQYPPPPGTPSYMQPPAYAQSAYAQSGYPQSYPAPPYPPQVNPYAVLPEPGPGEPFDGAQSADDLARPLYGANFVQAFTRFFKNYATFTGRASRSEFWWVVLSYIGAWFAFGIVVGILGDALRYSAGGYTTASAVRGLFGIGFLVVLAGSFIPLLSITWRRLHDSDFPGPFTFLGFIPFFGPIVLIVLLAMPPKVAGRRYFRVY